MTAAAEILQELSRRGVSAQVDGHAIRLKPSARLDDAFLAHLKRHKAELLTVLAARPALCSSTCYEIEPKRWVHHPWDGCKTCLAPLPHDLLEGAQVRCWHCAGSGQCDCVTCGHSEAHAAWTSGHCTPCSARKQAKVLIALKPAIKLTVKNTS
jgi:hypothetical protein